MQKIESYFKGYRRVYDSSCTVIHPQITDRNNRRKRRASQEIIQFILN